MSLVCLAHRTPGLTAAASKVSNVDESADQVEKVFNILSDSRTSDQKTKNVNQTGPGSSPTNSSSTKTTEPGLSGSQETSNGVAPLPKGSTSDASHDDQLAPAAAALSPEEELAASREINQNLQQMQPIVAELTLDDDWSNDEDEDEDDSDETENEFGMNSFREYMSDEYMDKMNALSRKYDDNPKETFIPADPKGKGPMIEMSSPAQSSLRTESKTAKPKGVRFAESLDIADVSVQDKPSPEAESSADAKPAPLVEVVQERSSTKPQYPTAPKPFQRLSKFKTARMVADVVAQRER